MNLSHSLLSHGGNNGGVNVNCGKNIKKKPISKLYRRGNKKDNPPSSSSSRARFSYTENHPTALHHTDDARNQQQQQQQRWWLSSTSSWYYYSIPPSIIVGNSSLRQRRSTVGVEPLRLQQQCVYLLPPTIRYEGETIAISRARVVEIIEHTRKTERKRKRKYAISVLNQILPVFFFGYATCVCVPRCLLAKNQPLAPRVVVCGTLLDRQAPAVCCITTGKSCPRKCKDVTEHKPLCSSSVLVVAVGGGM